jgi:hypothetical protein
LFSQIRAAPRYGMSVNELDSPFVESGAQTGTWNLVPARGYYYSISLFPKTLGSLRKTHSSFGVRQTSATRDINRILAASSTHSIPLSKLRSAICAE